MSFQWLYIIKVCRSSVSLIDKNTLMDLSYYYLFDNFAKLKDFG